MIRYSLSPNGKELYAIGKTFYAHDDHNFSCKECAFFDGTTCGLKTTATCTNLPEDVGLTYVWKNYPPIDPNIKLGVQHEEEVPQPLAGALPTGVESLQVDVRNGGVTILINDKVMFHTDNLTNGSVRLGK
jgi:hypothetical protein